MLVEPILSAKIAQIFMVVDFITNNYPKKTFFTDNIPGKVAQINFSITT